MFSRLFSPSFRNSCWSFKNGFITHEQRRNFRRLASTTAPESPSQIHGVNITVTPGVNITPKRGPTAYNIFLGEKFKELKSKSPELTIPAAAKLIPAEWQKLNPEEKRRYELESSRLQKEYEAAFFSMSTEEFRKAVMEEMCRLQKKRVTELRRQQKQLKEVHDFPRAETDYFKLQAVAKDNPTEMSAAGKDIKSRGGKMSELWNALPDEEKTKYEKREKAARSRYQRAIETWENQMRKKGLKQVVDLVKWHPPKKISAKRYRLRSKVLASKVSASKHVAVRKRTKKARKE